MNELVDEKCVPLKELTNQPASVMSVFFAPPPPLHQFADPSGRTV
jgi:hypothetical protein